MQANGQAGSGAGVQTGRQTATQTVRQADRLAGRLAGRQTGSKGGRQAGGDADRKTDGQAGRAGQTGTQKDRLTGRLADRGKWAGMQAHGQAGRKVRQTGSDAQADIQRQTGRHSETHTTADRHTVRHRYIQATTESLGRNVWHASPGHDIPGPPGTGTIVRGYYR